MTLESYSAAAVPIDCSQATVPDQIVPTGTTVQASRQVVATDHDVLRLHPNPPHELPNIPYPVKKKNLDQERCALHERPSTAALHRSQCL